MARPIRETPILYGEDAERFVQRMEQAETISREVRAANHRQLMDDFEEVKKHITFCL